LNPSALKSSINAAENLVKKGTMLGISNLGLAVVTFPRVVLRLPGSKANG
jgi:hypothetical protein